MFKVLLILNIVVALAGVGVVFYAHNVIKPPPTDQDAQEQALKEGAMARTKITPISFKKFIVNLHSQGTRLRYLNLEVSILPFSEDQKEVIKKNEHIFKDAVIDVASHMGPDELDTVTGKIILENRIKKRVNAQLGEIPVIKQIYFSDFVVQ